MEIEKRRECGRGKGIGRMRGIEREREREREKDGVMEEGSEGGRKGRTE